MSTFDVEPFEQPAPPPRPAFVDPRTYSREQARVAEQPGWKESYREWWAGLSATDQADMIALFKQTEDYGVTGAFVEWSLKRGKVLIVVIHWSREQSQRVGAK